MDAIIIRKVDDSLYKRIKQKSKEAGLSMNKFIIQTLKKALFQDDVIEHDDFDSFFGSWSNDEAKVVDKAVKDQRKIDKELWK